jgi:hypothetical protein
VLVLASKAQHLFAGQLIMHLVSDGAHLAGPVTPIRLLGIRIHDANLSHADQGGCDGDHG